MLFTILKYVEADNMIEALDKEKKVKPKYIEQVFNEEENKYEIGFRAKGKQVVQKTCK